MSYLPPNLGRSQRNVLHLLAALGQTTQQDLSETRLSTPPTTPMTRAAVSSAIERLKQRGLVTPAGWTDSKQPQKLWRLTGMGNDAAIALYAAGR